MLHSLDQINIEIPQGMTECLVSVVFKIGLLVSNATTIAIAGQGRICTPTQIGISTEEITRLRSSALAAGVSPITLLNPIFLDSTLSDIAIESAHGLVTVGATATPEPEPFLPVFFALLLGLSFNAVRAR